MNRRMYLIKRNFLFWLSRKIDYPLIAPDVLQVNFTFRCNLRCKMCSMHERIDFLKSRGRPYELDIPTIKKMITEAYDFGVRSLILIGGEPFLEPRLFELVAFANDCGMQGVTVVTNGTLLSGETVDKVFESGLGCLSISMDGASEETVAKIRGERVFGKIIENIERINTIKREKKISGGSPHIVSVCTIMDQNLEELIDIANLCRSLGVDKLIFQPVVGDNTDQTRVDFSSSVFIPSSRYDVLDRAIDRLIEYKLAGARNFDLIANSVGHLKLIKKYFRGQLKPRDIPCYAGYNRLQVVQEGKVYFCVNQDKYESTLGDVNKDNLKEIWFAKEARALRKIIKRCDFPCLQWCAYRDEFIELAEMGQKKRMAMKKAEDKKQFLASAVENDSYGFKLFTQWHNQFPLEAGSLRQVPRLKIGLEPRIEELSARFNVGGAKVLELGALEGGHSVALHSLGAAEILAIEGRGENFLKCLIVKNSLNLDRCKFILGDLNKVLPALTGNFDLCLAMGILYHLQDPVSVIYRIGELADSLFVWSHYAERERGEGEVCAIEHEGNLYAGRRVGENTGIYTSSLQDTSFWLFEEDFIKAVQHAGFRNVEVISKEKHPHGPAFIFFAKK